MKNKIPSMREIADAVSDKKLDHLYILCPTKHDANRLMALKVDEDDCFVDNTEEYSEDLDSSSENEKTPIILEFRVITPSLITKEYDGFHVLSARAIKFVKVWSGVVDDVFENELKDGLDEVALFGLARCTAVTCNALLKHFGKMGINLGDVPETDIGVLEILSRGGLSYKPVAMAAGRTVQQFAMLNQRGAFYLVTAGHAMALIDHELFDAENRGFDGRKIIQAYQIGRR